MIWAWLPNAPINIAGVHLIGSPTGHSWSAHEGLLTNQEKKQIACAFNKNVILDHIWMKPKFAQQERWNQQYPHGKKTKAVVKMCAAIEQHVEKALNNSSEWGVSYAQNPTEPRGIMLAYILDNQIPGTLGHDIRVKGRSVWFGLLYALLYQQNIVKKITIFQCRHFHLHFQSKWTSWKGNVCV